MVFIYFDDGTNMSIVVEPNKSVDINGETVPRRVYQDTL